MSLVVLIRRHLINRFRLKRWSTTLLLFLFLIIATVLLVSWLPNTVSSNYYQEALERKQENQRRINPKFGPLDYNLDKPSLQKDDEVNKGVESNNNQGTGPWLHKYGDRYAWFDDDNPFGNYEPTAIRRKDRPGDEGKEFIVENEKNVDLNQVHTLKSEYGMNLIASDHIPMDRSIPDLRLEECQKWNYGDNLPTASIVIVFHNEGFSTLMRTVHSVLLRSPRSFLREVVLVDDYSDKEPLKKHLDDYLIDTFGAYKDHFDPSIHDSKKGREGEELNEKSGKVRLVRNKERLGLINSRTTGANEAVGDVIVFLDAHCEVSYNWLPPLLAPIARNDKTMTVPVIDGIDSNTFHYRPVYARSDQHFKGIWEWGLFYKELEVDMKEHLKSHKVSEPYDAPTHAGGLFAISRKYFKDLGSYDPGLLVWGGENFELSFKVWQCGGKIQWVPCSRVGHVYRPFMPYSFGKLAQKRKGPLIITNYKRVVEVWWDDKYKEYFYTREPLARFYDPGDIKDQLAIKERLKCKSFDWFMTEVASDVYKHFPPLPPNVAWGEVRNVQSDTCLDTGSSAPPQTVHLSHCHSQGGNQLFRLNEKGQLGVGERCIEATATSMTLAYCKMGKVDGPWSYDKDTSELKNKGKCLEFNDDVGAVNLVKCSGEDNQKWLFKRIKPKRS